jgi:hypothetical protein
MTSSHNPLPDVGVSRLRPPPEVADPIRVISVRNAAAEDQFLRTRQAADMAVRSALAARRSAAAAKVPELAYRTIQPGSPHRRVWLPLRLLLVLAALAPAGMARYFAVQALGGSQAAILLWTCLFLGALSVGQIILDFCRKRAERAWRALATLGTRGKCLGPAFSSRAVTAASSASRPASPRAPPTATAVIVTALAAATRVIAVWTPQRWPQMLLQEG